LPIGFTSRHRPEFWLLALCALAMYLLWPGKLSLSRKTLDPAAVLVQVRALNELSASDIVMPSREEARIRLPGPRILENFLDEKSTKVWDRRITWWTPWVAADPDLEHKARLEALDQVRSAAVQMGILKDAQTNAERDIRAILQAFGISRVVFLPT